MWNDVTDLDEFYRSPLGRVARRVLRRRIRELWPDVRGMAVAGVGYATPYLSPFREEAARVVAVMPPQQGVMRWPASQPGLVTLADETELPFADRSVDRLLMIHALESSEQLRPMMREAWRVLSESGRMLIVVPNRRGIWARFERTPFGHGLPYSSGQIRRLLRDCVFTPMATERALFMPPIHARMVLSWAAAAEGVGSRWFPGIAGVLLVEAGKQIYAATPTAEVARPRRRLVVVAGTRAALRAPRGDNAPDA